MNFFANLFGNTVDVEDISEKLNNGGVIIDVRSDVEFNSGNIKNSKHFPLQSIINRENELKKLNKPLIFCCLTGSRSQKATNYFKNRGFDVINGGGWRKLNDIVNNL